MKVPLSWLAEFVDLVLSPEETAEKMTFAGLEVSAIDRLGGDWDREKVLVGRLVGVEPHPNADRLTLPTVEYGLGRIIRLVTGAPNIRVGMSGEKVPLALAGSRLIDGHAEDGRMIVLKESKIRGVASAGMICSEKELGLSVEHEGILMLPDDAPVGTPLADYLGETILEVEPTPNMSRCLSIMGVAREVAALTGQHFRARRHEPPAGKGRAADLMSIDIAAPELCARYCGSYIGRVTIGPSPFAIQRRLANAGMRPISNVVDATNYVMLEMGQPQHAFDYAALRERAGGGPPRIVVRLAAEGEKIVTLDGVERVCTPDTLLIADARGPIAVAGVMGGRETEVRADSKEILLESANFGHASIRRAAQRFKLPSQASLRFGKGLPASLAGEAARRGTALIAELTGGETAAGVADAYPRPQAKITVAVGHHEFSRLLGYRIPEKRVVAILESLDFKVSEKGEVLTVEVPEHRLDVSIGADLVEEVARMEGYDKLPATLMKEYLPPQEGVESLAAEEKVRDLLAAAGLEEVITYSLTEESRARAWSALAEPGGLEARGDFLRVRNPLTEDRAVLRVCLAPELLEALRANRRFQKRVAVFETGHVFHRRPGATRPDEPRRLGIVLWGHREEAWWGCPEPAAMDFFDLKGVVAGLLDRLGAGEWRLEPSRLRCLQEGRSAELTVGETPAGYLGELAPEVRRDFDLGEGRISLAEIDLDAVLGSARVTFFRSPSRFPAVVQDLALVVDEGLPAEDLAREIRAAGGDLLAGLTVFDVYRGEQVPPGKKSVAFSLQFQAADRTLTEEEASRRREKIVAAAAKRLGAVQR